MQQFSGRAAAPGLAQGSVVWFAETACGKTPQGTPAQELEKFRLAREDCTRRQAQLYQAALSDRVLVMKQGKLVQEGKPEEIFQNIEAIVFAGNVELVSIVEQYALVGTLPPVVVLKRGSSETLWCRQAFDILCVSTLAIPVVQPWLSRYECGECCPQGVKMEMSLSHEAVARYFCRLGRRYYSLQNSRKDERRVVRRYRARVHKRLCMP